MIVLEDYQRARRWGRSRLSLATEARQGAVYQTVCRVLFVKIAVEKLAALS